MAGRADQFKASFREEGREVLADLESALLELNESRGDAELVGRVFRAMHTTKGSGAMFGFEKLAAFAHSLENAFDEVRNGRLAISAELIDLTLSALDQIRAMLEEGEAGAPPSDASACAAILAKVRNLAGEPESQSTGKKLGLSNSGNQPSCEGRPGNATGVEAGQMGEWSIHFAPGADFMLNGANPLLLLRELGQLGGLSVNHHMLLKRSGHATASRSKMDRWCAVTGLRSTCCFALRLVMLDAMLWESF